MTRPQPAPLTASTPGIVRRDGSPGPRHRPPRIGKLPPRPPGRLHRRRHQRPRRRLGHHRSIQPLQRRHRRHACPGHDLHGSGDIARRIDLLHTAGAFGRLRRGGKPRTRRRGNRRSHNPDRVPHRHGKRLYLQPRNRFAERGRTPPSSTTWRTPRPPARRSDRSSAASSIGPGPMANPSPSSAATTSRTTATTPAARPRIRLAAAGRRSHRDTALDRRQRDVSVLHGGPDRARHDRPLPHARRGAARIHRPDPRPRGAVHDVDPGGQLHRGPPGVGSRRRRSSPTTSRATSSSRSGS